MSVTISSGHLDGLLGKSFPANDLVYLDPTTVQVTGVDPSPIYNGLTGTVGVPIDPSSTTVKVIAVNDVLNKLTIAFYSGATAITQQQFYVVGYGPAGLALSAFVEDFIRFAYVAPESLAGGVYLFGPNADARLSKSFQFDEVGTFTGDFLINHAPVITSNGGGDDAAISVLENHKLLTAITANDSDRDPLTYKISGGTDAALFRINSHTGQLTFKAAPDFENPLDANHDNIYDIVVRVSDGKLSDFQHISVTLANVANETIIGTTQSDTLVGAGGNDVLKGLAGDDVLRGGLGKDVLTGGVGSDQFVFDTTPNRVSNFDKIVDFSSAEGDKLVLSLAIFSGFSQAGAITADEFYAAAGARKAQSANDHLIYDSTKGVLYYDPDGTGHDPAVAIAQIGLHVHPDLAYSDFFIIA